MGNKTLKKLAIGAGLATLAGYVAGLLTAPQSGKESREDVKNMAEKSITEAEKQLKNLHTQLNSLIEEARQKGLNLNDKAKIELNELIAKTNTSKEKVRAVLSAVHEGDAEDKDLNKAVHEAKNAVAHIQKYLKK